MEDKFIMKFVGRDAGTEEGARGHTVSLALYQRQKGEYALSNLRY
jgi:hypothetical protein